MADLKGANLGLLLRCYEGLRNWRAWLLLVAGVIVAMLVTLGSSFVATFMMRHVGYGFGQIVLFVLWVVALLVLLAGINGAGLMLVDQADNKASRGFSAAFFGGLGVTLQAVACLLLLGVGLLLVVLVLWLVSLLGRIPGIGPVFAFLLAGPSMVVMAFCYVLLAFGGSLMFVALWRGQGIIGSIGRAVDIVVKRPLEVVLHFIVLALLIVPIELFVAVFLAGGAGATTGMYASGAMSHLGAYGASPGALASMLATGGNTMGAASLSMALVLAAVWAVFVLIGMLGNILIYDSLGAGASATSASYLSDKIHKVKDKVNEHRPRPGAENSAPRLGGSNVSQCGNCGAELHAGDRFCGECGSAQE